MPLPPSIISNTTTTTEGAAHTVTTTTTTTSIDNIDLKSMAMTTDIQNRHGFTGTTTNNDDDNDGGNDNNIDMNTAEDAYVLPVPLLQKEETLEMQWTQQDPSIPAHHHRSLSSPTPMISTSSSWSQLYWRLLYIPFFAFVNLSVVALFFFPLKRQLGLGTMSSLDELRKQMALLSDDSVWVQHGGSILGLYTSMYIFNQTFCVPGSIIMNMFAHIFGTAKGVLLVAFLTATGASSAFMMSKIVGRDFLTGQKWFMNRLGGFQKMVQGTSKWQLFIVLTALRIFPFTPNFFVNLASPILDIPLWIFFPSVIIGLLPFHITTVSAGQFIHELQSTQDLYQPKTVIIMILLSALVVAPLVLQRTAAVKKLFKLE